MQPAEEATRILDLFQQDSARALGYLEGQLNTLHMRAQVLMSLAGVVVTVTGFSGRIIAGTHKPAQICIIIGLSLVILSAVWTFSRVMSIRWVSLELEYPIHEAMLRIITRRDAKTLSFIIGGYILCAGLLFYGLAVCMMLYYPEGGLPAR